MHKGLEEGVSKGSGEEVPVLLTSHPVSMTVVGSFHWGSEAGTAVGEAWGQEPDKEDDAEDEDTFMTCQVQVFEADEAEREAIKWLAANPTCYKPVDSGSSVDIDHICQGAVFMTAKFEVFPTLSLKTFTHFTFPLRTYQTNLLSLPSFSYILMNQDINNGQIPMDYRYILKSVEDSILLVC